MKLTKRKGFNFFRSYYDVYNELSDKDKVAFMDALLARQFQGVKPTDLKGMAKFAYVSQCHSIDTQVKGYEDKTGIKLDPTEGATAPPTQGVQTPPTQQVQVEVQEKGKVQVQEKEEGKGGLQLRKTNFGKILASFNSDIEKTDLVEFYEYWTEHGPNDRKMRFEKEKSFDVNRRLKTWMKRKKEFAAEKKKDTRIHVDEAIENIKQGTTPPKKEWVWNNPKQLEQ